MPSWFESPLFQYSITRPITLRYFNPMVLLLGVVYVIVITLVNIIEQGYDQMPVIDANYNSTVLRWYNGLIPIGAPVSPINKNCTPSIIKVSESIKFTLSELIIVLATSSQLFAGYSFRDFTDSRSPIDGMIYYNTPFCNCSVESIQMTQNLYAIITDQVRFRFTRQVQKLMER